MKILFALDKYRAREGGADRVARGVVEALIAGGHELRVVEVGGASEERCGNVTLVRRPLPKPRLLRDQDLTTLRWNIRWNRIVAAELAEFKPRLLLTQNLLAPAGVAAAKQAGVRSVILFHGYRCMSPTFFLDQDALSCPFPTFENVTFRFKLKWPLVFKALELYAAAYQAADMVIANSGYAARAIERFFRRQAEVFYPISDLALPESPPSGAAAGPVLFVKPQEIKGVDTVLRVAQLLPQVNFVVAGAASRRVRAAFSRLPNVEQLGWCDDMDALYARCAALLAPARIPEPFGRVFVEAALRGLPAVATCAGGIPEAAGPGAEFVEPGQAPETWAEALRRALDPETRARLALASRAYAADLVRTYTPARLRALIELASA